MTNNDAFRDLPELEAALQKTAESLRPLVQSLRQVFEAIAPFLEEIAPFVDAIAQHFQRYSRFIDAVRATDWLPYHTVSLDYVEECGDDVSLLDTRLKEFYEENWGGIRDDIESRLDRYQISEETKATFREALTAHSIGHYRCVCRVLFPEIDKEFRIHFFEGAAGKISS